MSAAKDSEGGTLLRGTDGSLYFIRDEMLEALKVEGEGLDRMGRLLDYDTARAESSAEDASTRGRGVQRLQYVSGDLLRDQPDQQLPDLGAVKSTIMCPWFC